MLPKFYFICLTLMLSFTLAKPIDAQQQADREEDEAFETFLWLAMRNFTTWLSTRDPSTAISEEIDLKSDKRIDDGVDLDLQLLSQTISGYSKTFITALVTFSEMEYNTFRLTRSATTNDAYTFEGSYSTNGTISVDNVEIAFTGNGTWRLATQETFEHTVYKYNVTEDGYIQLETTPLHRLFDLNWTLVEFDGLQILEDFRIENGKNNITANDIENRIRNVLGIVYKRFLNSFDLFPYSSNPPQLLQFQYLTEVFSDITLSEIISRWTSTTTTPSSITGNVAMHYTAALEPS